MDKLVFTIDTIAFSTGRVKDLSESWRLEAKVGGWKLEVGSIKFAAPTARGILYAELTAPAAPCLGVARQGEDGSRSTFFTSNLQLPYKLPRSL